MKKPLLLAAVAVVVLGGLVWLKSQTGNPQPVAVNPNEGASGEQAVLEPVAVPSVAAPVLKTVSAAPSPGVAPLEQKQWLAVVEKVEKAIPTIQQVRALPAEQLHETPPPVREAAEQLGKMSELLHQHPEKLEEGAGFYKKCADQIDYMGSIRALCAANLRNISVVLKKPELFESSDYPPNVKNLADKIPAGW